MNALLLVRVRPCPTSRGWRQRFAAMKTSSGEPCVRAQNLPAEAMIEATCEGCGQGESYSLQSIWPSPGAMQTELTQQEDARSTQAASKIT